MQAGRVNPLRFAFAKRHGVLVTNIEDHAATVVYHQKPTITVLIEIQRRLQIPIVLEQVSSETFNELLVRTYETDSSTAMQMAEDLGESLNLSDLMHELPKAEDLLEKQDDAPIIRLLNALLSEAIKEEASDVHIETFENHVTIRFRTDGILREILEPPRILAPLIISRIKVMARLDIAEKRLPQDGRITLRIGGRAVDVRVSTMPTNHGERAVLRLLDKQTARLDLAELGMDAKSLELFVALIKKPHGIILVTGPTGSGKTTTLYAGLIILNDKKRNILTVEDPIEYDLVGIGQTQVNNKINMTFAKGLRAILRQDPDVVMVGEIRDLETAQIAIQASLTGHLVLSTLHTNSAIGAITRLDDMGVEPFLLASSLAGVLAQRLMRLLCNNCKKPMLVTAKECELLGIAESSSAVIYHPVGCVHCRQTGYAGRSGVYELIAIDESLRTMIHDRVPEQKMRKYARGLYPSLRQDGFRRVLKGETSLEEILRVTSED
ncbi:MAG: type II secretion system ATPase GspE [Gammaproteobacteria bacterium]|nr:type II secretion system ATPase GspE [Gammaproteobacteria bacterium]MCW5583392.1 type II secretion system ATPase GspE [Gammaproteobacteria bacterium]